MLPYVSKATDPALDSTTLPEINYDEVYQFDLTSQVKFWKLPQEEVFELFRDGRTASRFLERMVSRLFADFKYVDEKGYDWLRKMIEKVEGKCVTKNGCKFAPSAMVGSGRKIIPEEVKEHIEDNNLDYILMDIVEFPLVRMRFVKGSDLIATHPNCDISKAKKWRTKYFNV